MIHSSYSKTLIVFLSIVPLTSIFADDNKILEKSTQAPSTTTGLTETRQNSNVQLLNEYSQWVSRVSAFCEAIAAAYSVNDVMTLEKLMADNAWHVSPFGQQLSKAEFLQAIAEGNFQFSNPTGGPSYQLSSKIEMSPIADQPISFIATGMLKASAIQNGQLIQGEFRYSRVLIDQEGTLKELFSQLTPIYPQIP